MAQNPDRKVAYMPFFVGDEGTGKGVIIIKLLLPLFGKCGLHCKYQCCCPVLLNKFDATMEFKSVVFVDEG